MTGFAGSTPRSEQPTSATLVAAARNGFVGLAGSAVAAIAGFLLNVVVGQGLGVVAAGAFYVVVAVLTVGGTVARLGSDTGLVWALPRQRALQRPQDSRRIVAVAFAPVSAVGVVLALLLFLLADPLAGRLVEPAQSAELASLLRWGAPVLALVGPASLLIAGLRGMGSVTAYAAVQNLVIAGSRPAVVLVAVAAGGGLLGALLGWSLPLVAGVVLGALLLRRMLVRLERANPGVGPPQPLRAVASEFWRFASARSVAAIVEVAIVWADVLIVSALTGSREAGIYAAASRFITTGTLVEASLRIALAPMLSSRLAVGNLRGCSELYQVATQWIILLSWPLYIGLAAFADVLLSIFGTGFSDGATALRILALAMLVATAAGNSQTVLLMSGRSGWQLVNKSVLLALNIGLNVVLVPRWGVEGAAVAWAVTIVVDAAVVMLQVRYLVGVRLRVAGLLRAMVVGALSLGVVGLLTTILLPHTALATVGGLLVGGLVHLAVLVHQRRHFDADVLRAAVRRRRTRADTEPNLTEENKT